MARTFKVYNGDALLKQGLSPLNITGLTPLTTYNLTISALDGTESNRVSVPTFRTLGENIMKPLKASNFTTVNGCTLTQEGDVINLTSDGTARIQALTPTSTTTGNSVLTKPVVAGKTYKLAGKVKFKTGYTPNVDPLKSFTMILTGNSPSTRLINTSMPIKVSTSDFVEFSGTVGITGDPSIFATYFLGLQSDNASERFTGTIYLKDLELRGV